MSLEQLRQKIDKLDIALVELLNERAKISLQILQEKQKSDALVYNQKREQQVIQNVTQENNGPLTSEHIRSIFQQIIESCRNLQHSQKGNEQWSL